MGRSLIQRRLKMKEKWRGIMKKLLCYALVAAMAISSFTACNSTVNVSSNASSAASSSKSAEPMKITWLVYNQIGITPSNDSPVLKLIEERFNVDITVPEVDIHTAEQWNLYWASGNTPDAAFMNNTAATVFKLADQGLVRDIPAGYLDKYMPDWMKVIDSIAGKDLATQQTSYKGKQYICPWASQQYPYIMAVRKDWMDNVGVTKLPTTPDELLELAKKFTFNDPDKDGKNNTYGIHGGGTKRYMRFGYLNTYYGIWPDSYYLVNGKVTYTSTSDVYKESLKYLNSWYKAGVIDPEFATEDRTVQRKKWAEGKFGIIVDNPWWFSKSTSGNLTDSMTASNPMQKLFSLIPSNPQTASSMAQPGSRRQQMTDPCSSAKTAPMKRWQKSWKSRTRSLKIGISMSVASMV